MIKSTSTIESGVQVVVLEGRLDGTGGAKLQQLVDSWQDPFEHVVLEMEGVDYISSAGVGALLRLQKLLYKAGGSLVLVGITPFATKVLTTSGLLGKLRTAESIDAALEMLDVQKTASGIARRHRFGSRTYLERRFPGAESHLVLHGHATSLDDGEGADGGALSPVTLQDLGFSVGTGGFGNTPEQAAAAVGPFVSIPGVAGVLPQAEGEVADFIIAASGVAPLVHVREALTISGTPVCVVDLPEASSVALGDLLTELFAFLSRSAQPPRVVSFVALAETDETAGVIAVGVAAVEGRSGKSDPALDRVARTLPAAGAHVRVRCHGVQVDRLDVIPAASHPDADLASLRNIERLRDVLTLDPAQPLNFKRVWMYAPRSAEALVPAPHRETPAADYPFLLPPEVAGELGRMEQYRVVRLLGTGGMGRVFEAVDVDLKRTVALKTLNPDLASDLESRERFLREARATATIRSDHTVVIHHIGEQNGIPYLAMEFLLGESLRSWLTKNGAPPFPVVLRMGTEMARGLAAAHGNGVLHRDIKPENIWLSAPGDRVKILDFGMACPIRNTEKLTRSGVILGTPEYMAPERAAGKKASERCDLYSLGCVLYELATNERAFKSDDEITLQAAKAKVAPTPLSQLDPTLPSAYVALVTALLDPDPEKRPPTANAVANTLEKIGRDLSLGPPPRPSWTRRVVTVLAVGSLFILFAPNSWFFPEPEPPKPTVSIPTKKHKRPRASAIPYYIVPEPEATQPAASPVVRAPSPVAPAPSIDPRAVWTASGWASDTKLELTIRARKAEGYFGMKKVSWSFDGTAVTGAFGDQPVKLDLHGDALEGKIGLDNCVLKVRRESGP